MHRGPQRTVAVGVRPVCISPGPKEQLDHFLVAVLGSHVQRRSPLVTGSVGVGSGRQFPADGIAVA
jgi:hypothetical protein